MIKILSKKIAIALVAAVTGLSGLAAGTSAAQAGGGFRWSVTIGSGHHGPRYKNKWHRYNPHHGPRHGWRNDWRPHYGHRPNIVYVPTYRYVPRYVEPRYAPRRVIRLTVAHVNWCYNRYRSYREWDNSFNPGKKRPRLQCYSPYS